MILLYYSVFLPRLIYNAEAWPSLTEANIQCLLKAQLHYLKRVLEVPKSTPTAALFLDLGILPIQYEIEKKQLLYLKCVLEKNADDPVQQTYYQMLKYQGENNWTKHITFLHRKYNLPLNHWKKRIASKNCKKYGFSLEKFWYTCGISIFQRKYHTPKNFQYLEL